MTSYPNVGQPWQQQQQQQQEAQAYLSLNPMASPVFSKYNAVIDENQIVMDYNPPGNIPPPVFENQRSITDGISTIANKKVQWVYNPLDGSVLKDHNGAPLSVDRLLATNPLKHELSTRPGPGNKKLTYISGDDVSRTLNDVFGFDGWDLDIKDVSRVDASKDPKTGKHTIVYTARVRLTHKASGTYKEDCGAGDATDRVYGTAIAHALKASITDAMKRAARHFGDKLGNCKSFLLVQVGTLVEYFALLTSGFSFLNYTQRSIRGISTSTKHLFH